MFCGYRNRTVVTERWAEEEIYNKHKVRLTESNLDVNKMKITTKKKTQNQNQGRRASSKGKRNAIHRDQTYESQRLFCQITFTQVM